MHCWCDSDQAAMDAGVMMISRQAGRSAASALPEGPAGVVYSYYYCYCNCYWQADARGSLQGAVGVRKYWLVCAQWQMWPTQVSPCALAHTAAHMHWNGTPRRLHCAHPHQHAEAREPLRNSTLSRSPFLLATPRRNRCCCSSCRFNNSRCWLSLCALRCTDTSMLVASSAKSVGGITSRDASGN